MCEDSRITLRGESGFTKGMAGIESGTSHERAPRERGRLRGDQTSVEERERNTRTTWTLQSPGSIRLAIPPPPVPIRQQLAPFPRPVVRSTFLSNPYEFHHWHLFLPARQRSIGYAESHQLPLLNRSIRDGEWRTEARGDFLRESRRVQGETSEHVWSGSVLPSEMGARCATVDCGEFDIRCHGQ